MKKKCVLTVTALWLIMLLTACAPSEPRAPEDNFRIIVNLKSGVQSILYEYSLGGEPMGGGDVRSAYFDEPLYEGERLYFNFLPGNFKFPEKLRSEIFQITFTITDGNGAHTILCPEWYASFGREYEFTLEKTESGYDFFSTDGAVYG